MINRRTLSELLIEIADSVSGIASPPGMRTTQLQVLLPVDIEVARTAAGPEFRAELPRFVTRTSFDKPPSRVTVSWAERVQA